MEHAINGLFGNQGEVCNAGSRLLVDQRIAEDFSQRFTALAQKAFVAGDPLDPATTLGAMVNTDQQKRVLEYIDIGRSEGAQVAMGGGVRANRNHGAYLEPTLFTGVNNGMRIAREEVFGPVGAVNPFDTPEEAVQIANDSIYGLSAGIWTGNVGTAHRLAKNIEVGLIWINCFDHGDMTQPWGGCK